MPLGWIKCGAATTLEHQGGGYHVSMNYQNHRPKKAFYSSKKCSRICPFMGCFFRIPSKVLTVIVLSFFDFYVDVIFFMHYCAVVVNCIRFSEMLVNIRNFQF